MEEEEEEGGGGERGGVEEFASNANDTIRYYRGSMIHHAFHPTLTMP
jgi:hypothetical protein